MYVKDGMPDLTSPKDYEVEDFNNLVDGEGNVGNIYVVDKETAEGKENTYVYDETTDTVYKIPETDIGGQVYHSYECAEKGKGGTSSGESGQGGDETGGTITKESEVVHVENEYYYAPNLKGFNAEHTKVVYYTSDFSETKEVSAQEYIDGGEQYQLEEGEYIFHNYGETAKKWANVKTDANGKEAWWVWIPRYAYYIENLGTSSLKMNIIYIGIDDKPLDPKYGGTLPEGYELHPAFNQGGKKLKGIWMSKYEASFKYQEQSQNNNVQAPDMTGFDEENTYIELYDKTSKTYQGGADEIKLKDAKASGLNTMNQNADKPWYDYINKIWANVKTNANGKEAWWVWIPRYAYKITTYAPEGTISEIVYVGMDDKPIDKEKYGENLPTGYIVHPAFNQGGKKLKGIWMSKYEASFKYQEQSQNNNVQAPDMTGFDEENTYIELYDKTSKTYQGGADEIKLKDAKASGLNTMNQNADKPWYDYINKIWANVKTNANGKEAWWVWIPRYAYKITPYAPEGTISEIIYVGIDDKPIDKEKYGEKLPTGYEVHPAFNQGGKTLKGIWMSKYEASQLTN